MMQGLKIKILKNLEKNAGNKISGRKIKLLLKCIKKKRTRQNQKF